MKISQVAKQILLGEKLEDKLISTDEIVFDSLVLDDLPSSPARSLKLQLSEKKNKFPGKDKLKTELARGKALHFFANHELLAIEIMAYVLLKFPFKTREERLLQKGIYSALQDEQKHLNLYIKRMQELGVNFGDFPLNSFFWSYAPQFKDLSEYLAVMSLTFEAANLDFADYYQKLFLEYDDYKTANIMSVVLHDEIAHVALGSKYLSMWKQDKRLWDYYLESLPWPLTPMRSKAMVFNECARTKAGLPKDYIETVRSFDDGYAPTKRKEWKN